MTEVIRSKRKTKTGTIVSNKMTKTVVVRVETKMLHPTYGKVIKRGKKFYAHTEDSDLQMGDTVVIAETRPLSKTKRWRVVEKVTSLEGAQ